MDAFQVLVAVPAELTTTLHQVLFQQVFDTTTHRVVVGIHRAVVDYGNIDSGNGHPATLIASY